MTVHSDNNFMVSFVNHDSVLAHITATNPPKNKEIRLFTDTEPVESCVSGLYWRVFLFLPATIQQEALLYPCVCLCFIEVK